MTRGERVVAFIHAFCKVPEGKLVGQPVQLEPFQTKFILDVYDNPVATEMAILSMAKKNAKTSLIAMLVLAHVVGPEARQNSQITSGARSREQAGQVFNYASKMIALDEDLERLTRIVPSSKTIIGLSKNVTYKASSAEAKTAHGGSPVVVILDEVGQVVGPTDEFTDALLTSQGAHDDPLVLVISTQASSDADMLSIWIDDVLKAGEQGREPDPHVVVHLYEAPKDCNLMDRDAWAAANPALGTFRSLRDVEKQADAANRMPSKENDFRNKILNQRVQRVSPFINPTTFNANGGEPASLAGMVVYGGLDLSDSVDLTALTLIGVDPDGIHHWHCYAWTPEETMAEREKRDRCEYSTWRKQGFLQPMPGKTIDLEILAHQIGEICEGLQVETINGDPWHMKGLEKELERQGIALPIEHFGQTVKNYAPAMNAVEKLMIDGKVRHGGHPILRWCSANTRVWADGPNNRKPDKKHSTGRIDALVASVMAEGAIVAAGLEQLDDFLNEPLSV